jgi:hypothetical protein
LNCDPISLEAFLLSRSKEELRISIEAVEKANGRSFPAMWNEAKEALESNDWWAFNHLKHTIVVKHLFDQIVTSASTLPIDWEYLGGIAREFELTTPSPSSPESLRKMLWSIPHIYQYINDFNAFVGRETLIGNLPCVCIYENLLTASQFFLDIVMRQVLRLDSPYKAELLAVDELENVGSQPGFITVCRSVFDMILGRKEWASIEPSYLLSRSWPEMQLPCHLMFFGATDFVRLHEYGHLLRGHLLKQQTYDIEFQADEFAFNAGGSIYAKLRGASIWSKIGAMGILTIIAFIEMIEHHSSSKTHPLAQQRLIALTRSGGEESHILFIYVQAMLCVCRKTIESEYGVRYFPTIMKP